MNLLSPSILSADFAKLGEEIEKSVEGGADWIHIDVMDGLFVPSISYGMPVIKCIRPVTDKFFDVHLMVTEPIRYIKEFVEVGADLISVHIEACEDMQATIDEIKKYGKKVCIAVNPETSLDKIYPYIDQLDMVLVMSVHPGFGGQKYIEEVTDKIIEVRKYITDHNLTCDVEVDGGVNFENAKMIADAGANVIVAGSAVFKGDIAGNAKKLKEIIG